jgi:hypothetical protein
MFSFLCSLRCSSSGRKRENDFQKHVHPRADERHSFMRHAIVPHVSRKAVHAGALPVVNRCRNDCK